ncbi:MAG: hypothetical protein V1900_03745 [Candidatus Aenigmatarchaeota archaeon]
MIDRKRLIRELSKKRATHARFQNNVISLVYDNTHLRNKVIRRKEKYVANWSRVGKNIYLDKIVKDEDILPLLVHEAVEKYITERYKLNVDKESHRIAQVVERNFVRDKKDWHLHEERVEYVWKKENKKI